MGGYVFKPFPKCKYHPDGRVVVVNDAGAELALGPAWVDRPFPPAPPPDLSVPIPPPVEAPEPRRRGRPRKSREAP